MRPVVSVASSLGFFENGGDSSEEDRSVYECIRAVCAISQHPPTVESARARPSYVARRAFRRLAVSRALSHDLETSDFRRTLRRRSTDTPVRTHLGKSFSARRRGAPMKIDRQKVLFMQAAPSSAANLNSIVSVSLRYFFVSFSSLFRLFFVSFATPAHVARWRWILASFSTRSSTRP